MQRQSGWFVRHPYYLLTEPKEKQDLVMQVELMGDDPDCLLEDELDAWDDVKEKLVEMRVQAADDRKFWSEPYTSPQGVTHICTPEFTLERQAEAERKLRIAEAGLKLALPYGRRTG